MLHYLGAPKYFMFLPPSYKRLCGPGIRTSAGRSQTGANGHSCPKRVADLARLIDDKHLINSDAASVPFTHVRTPHAAVKITLSEAPRPYPVI